MRNLLVVLSGPSGVGKGTVAKEIVKKDKNFALSISCTTRAPRKGEKDGREYFFIDSKTFTDRIASNGFLEYSEHFENYYGTPRDFVFEKLKDKDVMLEIDVNGGLKVKENYKDAILIMLLPPSVDELKRRLIERDTESEEKIKLRMERMDFELKQIDKYDYSVINDNLVDAVNQILEIIKKEKTRIKP